MNHTLVELRPPLRLKNISMKRPRNCRSLGFPGFPVESYGFGQLHVVLFRENHISGAVISGAVESGEVGNPGTLGMTKERKGQQFDGK
jgi:hypothetical protein